MLSASVGEDAAVDDSEGLQVARLDLDPRPGVVGVEVDPLDADLLGEPGRDVSVLAHGAAP